jgi:hypothetical protein
MSPGSLMLVAKSHKRADSDEVARAFRDEVARYSDMMSPGVGASRWRIVFGIRLRDGQRPELAAR